MRGLMQHFPLTLPHLFGRAESVYADKEVITATAGPRQRVTYGAWAERTRRLGGALDALGVSSAGRVGTFAWNSARHLELYFAAPCTGRVLHTLNIRLSPEHLVYVINHAEDEVIFVDRSLAHLLFPLASQLKTVKQIVLMNDGRGEVPPFEDGGWAGVSVLDYEELIADARPAGFTVDDESRAASMCYTSGTTGQPKGVVYSHRSTFLHTLGVMAAGSLAVAEPDRVLPIVPMFHANAWGLTHAAVAAGATLVMPGPDLSPGAIAELIESERVTIAAGVPTIWQGMLPQIENRDVSSLRTILCGGSAVPKALSEAYLAATGLPILQAWGMTETSPLGAVCRITSSAKAELDGEGLAELRTSVGQPVVGVEARITSPAGGPEAALPWDGVASGELHVRGPWIAAAYHDHPHSADSFTSDGWLRTGDIAKIDPRGYIYLVDRIKDVIKSGGEWISSVKLENELMAHPDVVEAAVIGVPQPKWGERPVAYVVLKPGVEATSETKTDLCAHLEQRVPGWWLPDEILFIDQIPKTSVGKFAKKQLRETFAERKS